MSRPRLTDPRALPLAMILAHLGTDLFFNLTIIPNVLELLDAQDGPHRGEVLADLFAVSTIVMISLVVSIAVLTLPIARHLRGGVAAASPAALRAAGIALHKLPLRIALVMSTQQMLIHGITIALQPSAPSTSADVTFVLAMGCGPLPLCYALTALLAAPVARQVADASRAYQLEIPSPRLTLRWQLSGYTLLISLGPVLFLGSVAYTVQAQHLSGDQVTDAFLKYLGTVVPYAVVNAVLLAATISRPLGMMTDVIRTVARQGDVTRVGRIPYQQRDEVGELADWTNRMIDRLEQTATERARFAASIEALNHTLEQRVDEEVSMRTRVEIELRQAQKLEAVGRLASGIAHEINTPVQFINDSISFVSEATTELFDLIDQYRVVQQSVLAGEPSRPAAETSLVLEADADLGYLESEVPAALARSMDGLRRVTTIVRSMREFARPSGTELAPLDLNHALVSTLTIARHEYKDVAEVVTDLGEIPMIPCHGGDINQVILNLVVNAAHAIADARRSTPGEIRVATRSAGGWVELAVGDTGTGIPAAIRDRIFEPFFTTKEVGRGTGQGLAIARSIVARHGGTLEFRTEEGVGTTFVVRLPLPLPPPLLPPPRPARESLPG